MIKLTPDEFTMNNVETRIRNLTNRNLLNRAVIEGYYTCYV